MPDSSVREGWGVRLARLAGNFHLQMGTVALLIAVVDALGVEITQVSIPDLRGIGLAYVVALAGVQVIPVLWHAKARMNLRDASATLPWFATLIVLIPYLQDVAARLGRSRGLEDATFAHLDSVLGVSISVLVTWAQSNVVGRLANASYWQLMPYIYVSYLLAAMTGKARRCEEYIASYFLAMLISAPIFCLFPAVGPWSGCHFRPMQQQLQCGADLLHLRQAGPYVHHVCGVVCLPSGHVIAAILSAYVLWDFRLLRIPATMLSCLIVLSTLTTGWHYFVDVLGGAAVAIVSIYLARKLVSFDRDVRPSVRKLELTVPAVTA